MSIENKSIKKRIKTVLTVKLMEGKTVRDMYIDFFRGHKLPKGLCIKVTYTDIYLGDIKVSYDLYKKFSGIGASRDFLEAFDFKYTKRYAVVDSDLLVKSIYEVIPFTNMTGVVSSLVSYTIGANNMECTDCLKLEIETYSWMGTIDADTVKRVNKDNAKRLRLYLVSLPSVQGVPYSCSFKEYEVSEHECSV